VKTTIDISDALLSEVRAAAAQDGRTVRSVVEEGLRKLLAERSEMAPRKLRDACFTGTGMNPEFANASWDVFAAAIYELPPSDSP
jgi:hypothetical protein